MFAMFFKYFFRYFRRMFQVFYLSSHVYMLQIFPKQIECGVGDPPAVVGSERGKQRGRQAASRVFGRCGPCVGAQNAGTAGHANAGAERR